MPENKKIRIILIGNYLKDRQQSMLRFSDMLSKGFSAREIEVLTWRAPVIFGSFFSQTQSGIGKWLGYIDKWIIFPAIIWMRLLMPVNKHTGNRFHICDHSNSPYLTYLPKATTIITCHDVLAIKSAMGYQGTYCETSRFGRILQKWILKNLSAAKNIVCVSEFTGDNLKQVVYKNQQRNVVIIPNAFNDIFYPIQADKAWVILDSLSLKVSRPFILHVGGGHHRKNRNMLIKMVAALKDEWNGIICFAGEKLDEELIMLIREKHLHDRVISLVNAEHQTLLALYSCCYAFIFPSFSEGFGWPLIEAQACGAPVITSNKQPMIEVTGGDALFADPENTNEFKIRFMNLSDSALRKNLIEKGFINARRFELTPMLNAYLTLYDTV